MIDVPGALLFSPPDKGDACVKFHLCSACFVRTVEAFRAALPTVLEQRFASLERWLNVRAFDDTTAEECAQWQAAAEHLGHDADSVRVDFFKESGKWYCTEAVKWTGPYHGTDMKTGKITLIDESFAHALAEHLGRQEPWRLEDMVAVCLEPYHEYEHPLMMRVNVAKQRWREWNSK